MFLIIRKSVLFICCVFFGYVVLRLFFTALFKSYFQEKNNNKKRG